MLFNDEIPTIAAGKQGAVVNLDQAFTQPEATLKQAVENAKLLQMQPFLAYQIQV
ncbi:phosphotransferase system, fructose-specific IIC component [Actinobacillus equuli]|nr:phosphotransferase system, fructose-specific IIC component [Actinobacillus equuli]